jgi:tetratricopeptide (TPR) repeat protein
MKLIHTSACTNARFWDEMQHAIHLRDSGETAVAISRLQSLLSSASSPEERASVLLNLVTCYRLSGELSKAQLNLAAAKSLRPEDPYIHFVEACLLDEHNPARTLQRLNEVAAKVEAYAFDDYKDLITEIDLRRGSLLVELKRPNQALRLLLKASASELSPQDRQLVNFYAAICYSELGNTTLAKRHYIEALQNPSSDITIASKCNYRLGLLYYAEGALAQAKLHFETCEARNFDNAVPKQFVYEMLSKTCTALGEVKEAARYAGLAASSKNA